MKVGECKPYQRDQSHNIGDHILPERADSHYKHAVNTLPIWQKHYPAAIFAQPVRCKYSPGEPAKYSFNSLPRSYADQVAGDVFPLKCFSNPIDEHKQHYKRHDDNCAGMIDAPHKGCKPL